MKKLLLILCAALLCSCDYSDYIGVVTDGSDAPAVSSAGETTVTVVDRTSASTGIPTSDGYVTSAEREASADTRTEPAEETTAPPQSGKLTVTYLTDNVKKGNTATLSVSGTPGVTYSIAVYYSSTVSTAKGLEPKTADQTGKVSWSWRVGSRTKPGKHKIVISGGGEKLTLYFTTD